MWQGKKIIVNLEAITPIERKLRMPRIQGIKGDAVVYYRKPLITP